MNLLFAIDRNFRGHLCRCLHTIARNGGADRYDAYILHSDLTQTDREDIRSRTDSRITCIFIPVDAAIFDGFPTSARYPRQIYYRLAAPLLLPRHLERILYLDVDLVVINPLAPLYHMDFGGNFYIACSHTRKFLTRINQLRLGTGSGVPYINTGVMVINLPLLRKNLTIDRIRTTAQRRMHTFLLPDQDLLAILHGTRIQLADPLLYNLSDKLLTAHNARSRREKLDLAWVRKNAVIVHYCGRNKPWKADYTGILDVLYWENIQ